MMSNARLLTADEVAELLRVRVRRVYDLVRQGDLVGVWVGRYLRIDPADLEAYLMQARTPRREAEVVSIGIRS